MTAVRAALAPVAGWPALPGSSVVRLTGDEVTFDNVGRGPGAVVARADPEAEVRRRLDALRPPLAAACDGSAGLAVAHE